MLNKSDGGFSRKCPCAVDLENMAMPSARRRSAKTGPRGGAVSEELCMFCTNGGSVIFKEAGLIG